MKILVTGGAGFIGSHFLDFLTKESGFDGEIRVLDALTYAGRMENIENLISAGKVNFTRGSIFDINVLDQVMPGIDVVFNFAAESHVDRSIGNSSSFVITNVLGTQALLDSARKYGVDKYIQVSTDEVYGSLDEGSWDEFSPLSPNSPYSATKASADLLCLAYYKTFGLDLRITRCSNNYGPRQFPEKLIPLFATNLMKGQKVPLYGNGLNSRDWLYVKDHCAAIWAIMKNGTAGNVYNIGGGAEKTNLEISQVILEHFGFGEEMIEFVPDRLGHDFRYSVDFSKVSKLGYKPKYGFESSIHDTLEWYKNNQQWWKPLAGISGR